MKKKGNIKRDLHTVLTSEMSSGEWLKYREEWIAQYQHDLVTECGMAPTDDLKEIAESRWETYCGQEGWTGRDERIAHQRDIAYARGVRPDGA